MASETSGVGMASWRKTDGKRRPERNDSADPADSR